MNKRLPTKDLDSWHDFTPCSSPPSAAAAARSRSYGTKTAKKVEIHKDSGSGQWTFLALDIRPNYNDTTPMPTRHSLEYRAIYSNNAQRSDQWCNVAEVGVGG